MPRCARLVDRRISRSLDSFEGGARTSERIQARERIRVLSTRQKGLQTPLGLASRQQHAVIAFQTAQPDVGANANDGPIEAAARMWLTQPNDVADPKVDGHYVFLADTRAPGSTASPGADADSMASRKPSASRRAACCQSDPEDAYSTWRLALTTANVPS